MTTKRSTARKPATKKSPAVYVISVKQDGFRRAGRAWSGTTELDADELSKEQLQQLLDDPMFDVQPGVDR